MAKPIEHIYTVRATVIFFFLCLFPVRHNYAQNRPESSNSASTANPTSELNAQQDDSSALQQIVQYQKIVAPNGWAGLHARGTITYGHDPAAPAYPAELTLGNHGELRLDVEEPTGHSSLRLNRISGGRIDSDGKQHPLSPYVIANGILPFARLLAIDFRSHHLAAAISQNAAADARISNEISVLFKLRDYTTAAPRRVERARCDFFFDSQQLLSESECPTSHLVSSRITGISIVTYRGYQAIDGSLLPTEFSESVGGQLLWHLMLTSVDLHPNLTPDFFTVESTQ